MWTTLNRPLPNRSEVNRSDRSTRGMLTGVTETMTIFSCMAWLCSTSVRSASGVVSLPGLR